MDRSCVRELHYMTPFANLASIVRIGLLSHRRADQVPHESMALEAVQERRATKRVPGGRMLHEYVNLYFDARNAMMYRRLSGRSSTAVVRVHPGVLDQQDVVLTDGNAASSGTQFGPSPAYLSQLDATLIYAGSWNDPDEWTKMERKRQRCAEVLVPDRVDPRFIIGCYVFDADGKTTCSGLVPDLEVVVHRRVFFG